MLEVTVGFHPFSAAYELGEPGQVTLQFPNL